MEETAKKRRWWTFIVALIVFLVIALMDSYRYGWDYLRSVDLYQINSLDRLVACVEGLLLFAALICAIKGKKKTAVALAVINVIIAVTPIICVETMSLFETSRSLPLKRLGLIYSSVFAFVNICIIAYNFTKAKKLWKVAPIVFLILGIASIIITLVLSCYRVRSDGSMREWWVFPVGFFKSFTMRYTEGVSSTGTWIYPISIGFLYIALAAGLNVNRPEKSKKTVTGTGCTAEGYVDLVKMVLLSMFTFGIWPLIWIYRTTKKLNEAKCVEYYEPVNKLLLCIFVPFYQIYWYYKHGQRVDALAREKKLKVPLLDTPCLILGIFMPFVASALIQDRINMICMAPESAPEAVAAPVDSGNNADAIKKYKELLDIGAITQEEFDAKKKQLLGL